jgi:hypothetical protein
MRRERFRPIATPMEIVEVRDFERPPQQPQGSGSAASIGNAAAPSRGRQLMT